MKNVLFTDRIKCLLGNECHTADEQQNEIQQEEIKDEDTESRLNFQLFDIDEVFAN
ncbi:hypothetical protein [Flavobacterium wongokense]|uniref:hypothetical protein n=1 Tax=Flavobacterium wongokense TaxID=2910674 RepID=UPI001F28A169|nr:hypothetical protein [Flavobacterium sp. WG47]MCF6132492.1 hypothetical protein [Flavobacterium sp. WG47]